MEAILFVGIQGSGKSTFYRERFFATHVRINLDMLRTRRRERLLLDACLAGGQRFVVDNTNVTAAERARYIDAARAARFRVVGFDFPPDLAEAMARNRLRRGRERVPDRGLLAMYRRLQPPAWDEGFDELYLVRALPGFRFAVAPAPPPPGAALPTPGPGG